MIMAVCSYLALARFDDDQSSHRARSVNDIRTRIRNQLTIARDQLRVEMLQHNRRSLCFHDGDESDDEDFSISQPDDSELPPGWTSDLDQDDNAWGEALSESSTTTVASVSPGANLLDDIFSQPPPSPSNSQTSTSARSKRSNTTPTRQYKACQVSANSRSTPSPRLASSANQIISEFNTLKNTLSQCGAHETERILALVSEHWKVLSNACQCYNQQTQFETIELISNLLREQLLPPKILVNLLQHGLIYGLVDGAYGMRGGLVTVIKFFNNIAHSAPQIIPYMIELISNSKFIKYFDEIFYSGSGDQLAALLEFYRYVTDQLLSQIATNSSPQIPLLPDILMLTGVSKETLEKYGPMTTLSRCLTPVLISNIVKVCLTRDRLNNGDIITNSLFFLANAIQFATMVSYNQFEDYEAHAVSLIGAFHHSGIEKNLNNIVRGCERLIKTSQSSEHSSQGVGVMDSGASNLKHCNQFIEFYQQYYGPLYAKYSHCIEDKEEYERSTASPENTMEAW